MDLSIFTVGIVADLIYEFLCLLYLWMAYDFLMILFINRKNDNVLYHYMF